MPRPCAGRLGAKRRNKSNPWFKRGTLFGSAVDVLRRAEAPITAREIAETMMAGKAAQATRKQAIDLQVAILVVLRKRNGGAMVGGSASALAIERGRQLRLPPLLRYFLDGG